MAYLMDLVEGCHDVYATEQRARDHDRRGVLVTPPRCDVVGDDFDLLKELVTRARNENH
jgi:hypothetical protein